LVKIHYMKHLGLLLLILSISSNVGCSTGNEDSYDELNAVNVLISLDEPKSWTRNGYDQSVRDRIDKSKRAEALYGQLLGLIGTGRLEGSCKVGSVRGDAYITLGPKGVSVNYTALQYAAMEAGYLENIRIVRNSDGSNGLRADWINPNSGDGTLIIESFKEKGDYVVYIGIHGSGWSYFDNLELHPERYQKFTSLLESFK